ncbi:MAG TPA: hypothetical protein VHG53_03065 [Candidatus Limnocylindria bacterium]|nr:hypothetical protein [Candidatus Limnocylindria bacterium]
MSVALAVGSGAAAVGALAALAFVAVATRGLKRGAARGAAAGRGLRRGATVGSVAGLLALLRALDGLTVVTVLFVIAPFLVAEVVLSMRRA